MTLDAAAVRSALEQTTEPEIGRTLGELGLVREVTVDDGDEVTVRLALPTEPYPARDALLGAVTEAVRASGAAALHVDLDVLDEDEQVALVRRLLGDPAATAGSRPAHGHAEGRAIPFAEPGHPTRCVLIASGKGGVGKSSVTANLAVTLAGMGHSVGVIDADVWGFSIPRMLGVMRPPTVIGGEEAQMIVPPRAHGVRVISMGFFAREDQPVIWRGPMLHKALEQFLTDVWWDDPDFLLLDLPPGTGDISLSLAQFLPRGEVYVVTTPQPAAQQVAQRAAYMAQRVRLQVRGVIENMSWFTADDGTRYELFGSGGGEELAAKLGVPLVGRIPLVPALREGADEGRPVVLEDPGGEAAEAFRRIAAEVVKPPPRRYRSELKLV